MSSQAANGQANATNYPLNCWWVAARSDELGEKPFRRWLLDTPVALYRLPDGTPVALDDRCPHRWAPLSDGWLDGDAVVCPYHGARFEADGRCSAFPNQVVPSRMRVRSFAVVERGPFIWIWMGDDAARETAPLPPTFDWPEGNFVTGDFVFEANYMLLHENVLDLSHFVYLHKNSFGVEDFALPTFVQEGERVGFRRTVIVDDLDEGSKKAFQVDDGFGIRQESDGWFETPAWHSSTMTTYRRPGGPYPEKMTVLINHLVTPEHMGRTRYWWYIGFLPAAPEDALDFIGETFVTAFNEDKVMLRAIQETIERDPRGRDYPEYSFRGDEGGVRARRMLDKWLAAERVPEPARPACSRP